MVRGAITHLGQRERYWQKGVVNNLNPRTASELKQAWRQRLRPLKKLDTTPDSLALPTGGGAGGIEINILHGQVKTFVGHFIEPIAKQYIKDNKESLVAEYYASEPPGQLSTTFLETDPQSREPLGTQNRHYLAGWCGDLVMMVNTQRGKVALIYEIKYGHAELTRPQEIFFKRILEAPWLFMPKLIDVRVYVVRCHHLELRKGTMKMNIEPYINRK
jgi:hypothetical protein